MTKKNAHAVALRDAIFEYLEAHPAPWPAELRAFDVTGHAADLICRRLEMQRSGFLPPSSRQAAMLFEARVEVALWLDENAPRIHPASPRDQLVAYLAAHG